MPFTESEIEKCTVKKGDLLVCEGGDIGRSAIWSFDEEIRIQNHIHRLRSYTDLSNRFYYYVLFLWKRLGRIGGQGIGLQGFSSKALHKLIVPLPPHKEQITIVEKLDSILDSVDDLDELNSEFTIDVESVKKQILDLAILGKLVPQNPEDEPASVLLERIRAEKEELIKQGKIKRDKKESVIFKGEDNSYYEKIDGCDICIDEKIPFSLPENWRWERLGNISTIARGGSPRPIEDYLTKSEDGINWIKIGDTEQGGKYISSTREKIIPAGLSKTRYVKSGDFLLTNSMSFGRPYILKTNGCIHDGWLVIGDIENVFSQDYLYYTLSSSFMYKAFSEVAAGSTVKNLKSDTVRAVFFPVPPYDEQVRIANYVEKLFASIESIEKSLV